MVLLSGTSRRCAERFQTLVNPLGLPEGGIFEATVGLYQPCLDPLSTPKSNVDFVFKVSCRCLLEHILLNIVIGGRGGVHAIVASKIPSSV